MELNSIKKNEDLTELLIELEDIADNAIDTVKDIEEDLKEHKTFFKAELEVINELIEKLNAKQDYCNIEYYKLAKEMIH